MPSATTRSRSRGDKIAPKQVRSTQHAAHMEHADWLARNEDVGWPYDDDDDDDDDDKD